MRIATVCFAGALAGKGMFCPAGTGNGIGPCTIFAMTVVCPEEFETAAGLLPSRTRSGIPQATELMSKTAVTTAMVNAFDDGAFQKTLFCIITNTFKLYQKIGLQTSHLLQTSIGLEYRKDCNDASARRSGSCGKLLTY
jgi:hypothetical protein